MTPQFGQALVLGLLLGIGCWSVVLSLPVFQRLRLIDRVAPHLVDVTEAARMHLAQTRTDPLPILGSFLAPVILQLRRGLSSIVGGDETIRVRLRQSGTDITVERFRASQVTWGLAGAGIGTVIAALAIQSAQDRPFLLIIVPLCCAALAVGTRDLLLRMVAERRTRRIASEYPTILEFMTLSLAAGEGIYEAMTRVGRLEQSHLGAEFGLVVRRIQTGTPSATALREMSTALGFVPLQRTCDHIITAMERGAPLVEVLQAQSRDVRTLAKRELLEIAGRNEIRMMVPLVLLILPVTVLFAVFPSFFVLTNTF